MSWLAINPLVNHMRSQLDPDVMRFIGSARDLAAARLDTLQFPSLWFIPLGEAAGPNRYEFDGVIDQVVTVRLAVLLAVRDIADRTGTQAGHELETIRPQIHDILTRRLEADAETNWRFTRGALVSSIGRDGALFWQDEFTTTMPRRTNLE